MKPFRKRLPPLAHTHARSAIPAKCDLCGRRLGGCMLTEREMRYRAKCAEDQNIPFTNYGITLAQLNGILQRSIEPLSL